MEDIGYELDDDVNPLTIKIICYKISEKYGQTNVQSDAKKSIKYERSLYVKTQYTVTCTTWGKYEQKPNIVGNREGVIIPKCNYCNKLGHLKRYCCKIVK